MRAGVGAGERDYCLPEAKYPFGMAFDLPYTVRRRKICNCDSEIL